MERAPDEGRQKGEGAYHHTRGAVQANSYDALAAAHSRAVTTVAALPGLIHGYLNGTGIGQSGFAVVAVVGLASAVFVLIALPGLLLSWQSGRVGKLNDTER